MQRQGCISLGQFTDEGLIVFAGSRCNLKEVKTAAPWLVNMRKKLFDSGIFKIEKNILVFTANYVFQSPSAASGVVLARSSNGWVDWKFKNGKTLDEVKRKNKNGNA